MIYSVSLSILTYISKNKNITKLLSFINIIIIIYTGIYIVYFISDYLPISLVSYLSINNLLYILLIINGILFAISELEDLYIHLLISLLTFINVFIFNIVLEYYCD